MNWTTLPCVQFRGINQVDTWWSCVNDVLSRGYSWWTRKNIISPFYISHSVHYISILSTCPTNTHAQYTGLFNMIVGALTTCHTQYTWDSSICIFYLTERHPRFLLHILQVLYMCTVCDSTNINTIIEFVPTVRSVSAVMVSMAVLIRTFSYGILAGRGGTWTWTLT